VAEINQRQIDLYTNKVLQAAASQELSGKNIAFLGTAFKKDEQSIENSPALALLVSLIRKGATLHVTDAEPQARSNAERAVPHLLARVFRSPENRPEGQTMGQSMQEALGRVHFHPDAQTAILDSDIQVLATDSGVYKDAAQLFFQEQRLLPRTLKVVDGRHFWNSRQITELGGAYYAVGIPTPASAARSEVRYQDKESLEHKRMPEGWTFLGSRMPTVELRARTIATLPLNGSGFDFAIDQDRWLGVRGVSIAASQIYPAINELAIQFNLNEAQALALILRELLGKSQESNNQITQAVLSAARENLGPFASFVLDRTAADRPVHVMMRASKEELLNGDVARLLALLNVAHSGSNQVSFYISIKDKAELLPLINLFQRIFSKLGISPEDIEDIAILNPIAPDPTGQVSGRIMRQNFGKFRGRRSLGVVDRSLEFLEQQLGYIPDLARIEQGDIDLNTALVVAASLLKEDLNYFSIIQMRQEIEKRGGITALVQGIANVLQALRMIETKA
jgi:hypothetical protein